MEFLVPHVMELLWLGREDLKKKVMTILKGVINQGMNKMEASPTDEYLMENIPHFFDMEISDKCNYYLGSTVVRNEKKLQKSVQSALVPLLIHPSDQHPSVAKIQI